MAALELHDTEGPVLKGDVTKAIAGLEQPRQKVQLDVTTNQSVLKKTAKNKIRPSPSLRHPLKA